MVVIGVVVAAAAVVVVVVVVVLILVAEVSGSFHMSMPPVQLWTSSWQKRKKQKVSRKI